jgi:hypothetical protein
LKIEYFFVPGPTVAQNGRCLARIVVAVMKKESDFAAHLALQSPGRDDLRKEKSFRKKAARLLTETDERRTH